VLDSSADPCDSCPPLPFIGARGEAKAERDKSYSARSLGCPFVRHCPPERIEVELRCVVVEAAAWPDGVVHSRTPGAPSE
jgi:hypothetical protein